MRECYTIFPIDVEGFLDLRGSTLGGLIELGVSWRPLQYCTVLYSIVQYCTVQ